MHGDCIIVQLGGNANEVVISPNMADRERCGPCSECLIPQDSRTPCLLCDQLLCEKCLPQEKAFASDVPGDIVYSDQCMTGADTRKTTQWYCNVL